MEPESAKPVVASPLELAMLAALLDGPACCSGDSREALLRALALLEESAALCREFGSLTLADRRRWLMERCLPGPGGEAPLRLLTALQRPVDASERSASTPDASEPSLYLSRTGTDEDTLRSYLAEHCNLAGRRGSKFVRTETVLGHLRDWITASCDVATGVSVADAQETFLENHATRNDAGQFVGYTFPKVVIDLFIGWRLQSRTYRIHSPGAPPRRKKVRRAGDHRA